MILIVVVSDDEKFDNVVNKISWKLSWIKTPFCQAHNHIIMHAKCIISEGFMNVFM